jgi:NTP pyrophosphatase (non-canonical NTP hydrolase)
MDIRLIQKRALEIREKYKQLEIKKSGHEWTNEQIVTGFKKDVSDLLALVKNHDQNEKLAHELSDCLWSVIIIANKFNIDVEKSFFLTMNILEEKIDRELK